MTLNVKSLKTFLTYDIMAFYLLLVHTDSQISLRFRFYVVRKNFVGLLTLLIIHLRSIRIVSRKRSTTYYVSFEARRRVVVATIDGHVTLNMQRSTYPHWLGVWHDTRTLARLLNTIFCWKQTVQILYLKKKKKTFFIVRYE